jgi:hypothetical protein
MNIYCITHKKLDFIENIGLIPSGVGQNKFPENYLDEKIGENISYKNYNYGEVTFHYWFWKNKLSTINNNEWFGICHYRRFFLKHQINFKINNLRDLKSSLALRPKDDWKHYDTILCEPISLKNHKKIKLIKKAFRSLLKDPTILFNNNKHTIKLHFEMFHGYNNLDKAISMLPLEDRGDFENYVSSKTAFSPNCMFLSNKPLIVSKFYQSLFSWLTKCENIFGFSSANNYGTRRMYTFLTERYLPFWFEKYSKVKYAPWIFYEVN